MTLIESAIPNATLFRHGKVREVYEAGPDQLVMVASDRLSAFDVVLPTPIPDKGRVLTQLSNFWFGRTAKIVPNHLVERLHTAAGSPKELIWTEGGHVDRRPEAVRQLLDTVRTRLVEN